MNDIENIRITHKDLGKNIQIRDIKDLGKNIQKLENTLQELIINLKTFTDAKGWRSTPKGDLYITRYANYYDVSHTIETAGPTDPNDFDSPIYNVERIFESLERYAEYIEISNDGTDTLFIIISHGGRTNFSQETPIFPGETKIYYNVYELRLRSPTQGLPYRVTEYDINNVSQTSLIPIQKAVIHVSPLPATNTDWLSSDIIATRTPTTYTIDLTVSIAGIFSAQIIRGGIPTIVNFNNGIALIPGSLNHFHILVHSTDMVNFQYSTTGGTIQFFRVQELDSATAGL
jgi:hypothetical protein